MAPQVFEAGMLEFLPLLQRVARRAPDKRVKAREAEAALAAAECVAAAAGRPPAAPSDDLLRWLSAHPGAPPVPLMAAAIKALDRLRGEPALPADARIDDLRSRLSGR